MDVNIEFMSVIFLFNIENLHWVNELVLAFKSILGDSYTPVSQLQKQTVLYVVLSSTGHRH